MRRLSYSIFAFALCSMLAQGSDRPKQPNILWIITDDQRADSLSCFNQATIGQSESRLGFVHSPRIDALASEGVLFTSAYCNAPICGPSRASMHTGSYPHHGGRYAFEKSHQRADVSLVTVPQVMREQGYITASFGKRGFLIAGDHYETEISTGKLSKHGLTDSTLQNKRIPGPWSPDGLYFHRENYFYEDGATKTIYTYRDEGLSEAEKIQKESLEEELDILRAYTRQLYRLIVGGVSPQPTRKTLDGEIAAAFSTYLNHLGENYETPWGETMTGPDPDKPLFAHLSFHLPHTPVLPSKEYRQLFEGKTYKVPDFSKSEVSSMPAWLRDVYVKMNFADMKLEDKQQAIRDYYAFCAMGDELISDSAEQFKKYSEAQGREWLILYLVGDHGWHLGEQGIHAKFAPWSRSTRGAIIAVSSDKEAYPPGTICDKHVEYVDFAPTFYEAGGLSDAIAKYAHLDGVPLAETLRSKEAERPYVLAEVNHATGPWASMRTRDFLFGMKNRPYYGLPPNYEPNENVRWGLDAPREEVGPALYDLRVDPDERCNLADTPEYSKLADWFRAKLGNIVLGDGRVEINWQADNEYNVSNFALGSDDKELDIPDSLVPELKRARKIYKREFTTILKTDPM